MVNPERTEVNMSTHSTPTPSYYSIDDGDSNLLATGLSEHDVWRVARSLAARRGESVWIYRGAEPAVEVAS